MRQAELSVPPQRANGCKWLQRAQLTNGDVVSRRHRDHPRRTSDNLLIVLLDVRLSSGVGAQVARGVGEVVHE